MMIVKRMAAIFLALELVLFAAVALTPAQAETPMGQTPPAGPSQPSPAETYVSELVAAGWQLTALGQQIAAGATTGSAAVAPPFNAPLGVALLATRRGEKPQSSAVGAAYRRKTSTRRLAASQYVGYLCYYGQTANMNFSTGPGDNYVSWWEANVTGVMTSVVGPVRYCYTQYCAWYAWDTPPSSRRVTSGTAHNTGWVSVDGSWCG
jgi:hypothetical protein